MRILMGAYACEPARGSEPGAGWAWATAAARDHDVWVLTHATNREAVTAALAADPRLAERLHPVFLRNARWARPLRRRGPTRFLYYLLWQVTVCRVTARQLHAEIGFDVTHHVTYASDWMPAGVATLTDVPFVWGPVGGSSTTGRLRTWLLLGAKSTALETARAVGLGLLRRLVGRATARRAAAVLGQNADVAAAFAPRPVTVQPNVAVEPDAGPERRRAGRTAIFAGRLLHWKGLRFALAALRRPEGADWHLHVYGDGPERTAVERLSARWGLAERVHLHGARPRAEFLDALRAADVFLFPSLHDSAGWSVAEALAHGCPVVCLDSGGPASLVGAGDGVVVGLDGDLIGGLAAGLAEASTLRPVRDRWTAARLPGQLERLYHDVVDARSDGRQAVVS